jgi:hypothetical protein
VSDPESRGVQRLESERDLNLSFDVTDSETEGTRVADSRTPDTHRAEFYRAVLLDVEIIAAPQVPVPQLDARPDRSGVDSGREGAGLGMLGVEAQVGIEAVERATDEQAEVVNLELDACAVDLPPNRLRRHLRRSVHRLSR